jgi:hypothetical protein
MKEIWPMGIMDGAANGLKMRLESAGVRSTLAFAIGQVAYVSPHKIPSWVAPAAISKSEIKWWVSECEKDLHGMPEGGLASIAVIQGLCNHVFGIHGEAMIVGSYPEFSEDRWEETVRRVMPESAAIRILDTNTVIDFSEELIYSDTWWDSNRWVSSDVADPSEEEFAEALHTSLAASMTVALLGRKYFDTPRGGTGKYVRDEVVDKTRDLDDLSIVCNLVGPNGQSLEGLLIQSGNRIGFFDGDDIMVEDLNDGSPILFDAESVVEIYCALDECLMEAAGDWERIQTVPLAGKLELSLQFRNNNAIRLEVRPEFVLTDPYHSRYYVLRHFLNQLDRVLSGSR